MLLVPIDVLLITSDRLFLSVELVILLGMEIEELLLAILVITVTIPFHLH